MKDATTQLDNRKEESHFQDYPTELIVLMLQQMSVREAIAFSQTNKRHHAILNQKENNLWQFYLNRDFPKTKIPSTCEDTRALYEETFRALTYHATSLIKVFKLILEASLTQGSEEIVRKVIQDLEEALANPLMRKQLQERTEEAKILVRNSANEYFHNNHLTPFNFALLNKLTDLACYLIEIEAMTPRGDRDDESPLYFAVLHDNPVVTRRLLENSAVDTNLKNRIFMFAVVFKSLEIVKLFIEHQININAEGPEEVHRFQARSLGLFHTIRYRRKPLTVAIIHSSNEVVYELIDRGATVSESDMILAIRLSKFDCVQKMLQTNIPVTETMLLEAIEFRDVDILGLLVTHATEISDNVLMQACESGKDDLVLSLLKDHVQFNPNFKYEGYSLLTMSARNGNFALFEMLLNKGADLNTHDEYDTHIMSIAASINQVQMLECLIRKGSQPSQDNPPLSYAAANAHEEATRVLIQHGHDPNQVDENGVTPLVYALSKPEDLDKRHQIVEILVEAGAEVNKAIRSNMTPLMFAAKINSSDSVRYLIDHGADVSPTTQGDFTLFNFSLFKTNLNALSFATRGSPSYTLIKNEMNRRQGTRLPQLFSQMFNRRTNNQDESSNSNNHRPGNS